MPTPDHNKQRPRTDTPVTDGASFVAEDMQTGDELWVVSQACARKLERKSATQLQTIGEAAGMLATAGRRLIEYGSDYGFTLIEKAKELRALARPAHTEGLADKGGEA